MATRRLVATAVLLAVGVLGACKKYDPVDTTQTGDLSDSDPRYYEDNTPYDEYPIQANSGMQLTVEMSSDEFDAFVIVLDGGGDPVAGDDDGGGGTNARLVWEIPSSGNYSVLANCFGPDDRGAYEIHIKTERR